MSWLRTAYLLFALLVILACGGGGSGVQGGTLTFSIDWVNRSQPGGGLSQRLRLYDQSGALVASTIASYGGADDSTAKLDAPTAGTYRVQGELYSQTGLGGVQTGSFRALASVGANSTMRISVGGAVASVLVTPETTTVQVPGSVQFYAAPKTVLGDITFQTPAAITWQSFGGVGAVDANGLLVANAAGSGSVRATHIPTSSIGSGAVTATTSTPTHSKWTILVYLNAANDLARFSPLNMNQLEKVAGNPDVRYVVQWKQSLIADSNSTFDGTRRYLVKPDTSEAIASQLVQQLSATDMGRPQSLADFIAWGKQYYPADRYGVIVWNHGNGWRRKPNTIDPRAVSYDDETGNAIQIWELKTAFASQHLDFVAWDSSLMQMLEVAFEIRTFADYIVGSEESPPGAGYPYDAVFARFRDNPDDTTRNLTKAFVDAMVNEPGYAGNKITQSVLESSKLATLATATSSLAEQLSANAASLTTLIPTIRSQAQSYSNNVTPPRYYRDLYDVCLRLEAGSSIVALQNAAAATRTAISQAVVWEGHNANSPGSHGVSIDFTQGTIFMSSSTDYGQMEFATATHWDDWLVTAP